MTLSNTGDCALCGGIPRRRQDGKAAEVTLGIIRSAVQAGLRQLFGSVGGAVPFEVVGTLAVEGAAIIKADRGCGLGAASWLAAAAGLPPALLIAVSSLHQAPYSAAL